MIEIYYMEDDKNIATAVKEYLSQKGYAVFIFGTLESGKKALEHHIPSLALIDWNMPDGGGNSFCRWIRSRWKELPVIFLTVRDDTCDIISGFEYGADDYVTKPFELEILYSRIHALLRRAGNVQSQYLSCGSISIDKNKTAVICGEEEITVSQAEYQLLQILMENKGKTVTRERLPQGRSWYTSPSGSTMAWTLAPATALSQFFKTIPPASCTKEDTGSPAHHNPSV